MRLVDRVLRRSGSGEHAHYASVLVGHPNGSGAPHAAILGNPTSAKNVPEGTMPASSPASADRALLAKRDRLRERFTAMQLDLGGVFYEMTIRNHVQSDVLSRKAAELQRVDTELHQVEQILKTGGSNAGRCPACEVIYTSGAAFCWQCGASLVEAGPSQ
jgi:hypothetical protein